MSPESGLRFALNHIATPSLPLEDFLALSRSLGITEVEIRNDLPDVTSARTADEVRDAAEEAGITLLTINALYPFNDWSESLSTRAHAMADYARDCGARALVLCPRNDGTEIALADTVAALERLGPILSSRGLTGLVEPLGFPVSSLRTKARAIEAIEAAGGEGVFRLLHDTFHHRLAGETEVFEEWTELVHVSGVSEPSIAVEELLDEHRVLIDGDDRLGNVEQIRALGTAGYAGPYSFEPFARAVHELADPGAALRESMAFLESRTR